MSEESQQPVTPIHSEGEQETKKQVTGVIRDLQEERSRRHALEAEIQSLKEQTNQYAGLRQELDEWRRSRQQPAQPTDDFDSDPIGYLKRKTAEQERIINDEMARRNEESRRANESNNLVRESSRQVDDYRRTNPDYDDAFQYMVSQWTDEYKAMGLAPYEINDALNNQALNIMQYANSRRTNPAEMIHKIAKSRGYKTTEESGPRGRTDDYPSHRRLSRGSEEFERLRSIENMSDDEFDKLWDRMAKDKAGT